MNARMRSRNLVFIAVGFEDASIINIREDCNILNIPAEVNADDESKYAISQNSENYDIKNSGRFNQVFFDVSSKISLLPHFYFIM